LAVSTMERYLPNSGLSIDSPLRAPREAHYLNTMNGRRDG
jgi:hypothetical protein